MMMLPVLALFLAASCLPPHVSAAILTPLEVHQSINITGVTAVAVSPDGNHVYAAAQDGDSLARYVRNPDGSLGFVSMLRDGVGGVDGLDGARDVALSPDGSNVYVVADTDDAISVFARDALTGALTLVQSLRGDQVAFPLDFPGVVLSPDGAHVYVVKSNGVLAFARSPLTGSLTFVQHVASGSTRALALSPDGTDVYLGGDFSNLLHYARNPLTGSLTFVELSSNVTSPADLVVSPDGATVYATRGNLIAAFSRDAGGGLTFFPGGYGASGELTGVAIDSSGAHVYAVDRDTNTIHAITRDPLTGTLTPLQELTDGSGGVDGLARAADVALSPDGGSVYVAGAGDAAVVAFERDGSTGTLTFIEADADAASGTSELVDPARPIVAPDGLHVYVPSFSLTGTFFTRLVVFSRNTLDGSLTLGPVALSGVSFEDVVISQDGNHVYVARRLPDQVEAYARSTATGALTPIASYPGPGSGELSASPDGRHVYASPCTPTAVQVFERDGVSGLLTPGAMTSPPLGVFTFSADGRFAYADGEGGFDVYARDPGTGALTFVAREDNDDPEFDDTLTGPVLVAVSADDRMPMRTLRNRMRKP
jgi:6-phosphogluconolactonase (cycloisomerase 2 family)